MTERPTNSPMPRSRSSSAPTHSTRASPTRPRRSKRCSRDAPTSRGSGEAVARAPRGSARPRRSIRRRRYAATCHGSARGAAPVSRRSRDRPLPRRSRSASQHAIDALPDTALDGNDDERPHARATWWSTRRRRRACSRRRSAMPTIDDVRGDQHRGPHRGRRRRSFDGRPLDDAIDAVADIGRQRTGAWAVGQARDAPRTGVGFEPRPQRRDRRARVRDVDPHRRPAPRWSGSPSRRRDPQHLALMSDLAGRILPPGARGWRERARDGQDRPPRAHRRRWRRVAGPMGGGDSRRRPPDVTLTADVVDWCRLVGDRIEPDELRYVGRRRSRARPRPRRGGARPCATL